MKDKKLIKIIVILIICLISILLIYYLFYYEECTSLEDGTKVCGDIDSIEILNYTIYTTSETDFNYKNLGEGPWIPLFDGVLPTIKEIEDTYDTVQINGEDWNVYKHRFQTPVDISWKVLLIDCHNNEVSSPIGDIPAQ